MIDHDDKRGINNLEEVQRLAQYQSSVFAKSELAALKSKDPKT